MSTVMTFASAEILLESDHPYANNFYYTWPTITESGATQMRLHFTKLELKDSRDYLNIFDKDGNTLITYNGVFKEDMWTEWFTGDTLKVNLKTNGAGTAYGFQIDQVETIPTSKLKSVLTPTPVPTQIESSGFSILDIQKSSETSPEINIKPIDKQELSNTKVFLSGSASSDSGIKSVTVNGQYAGTEHWELPVDLSLGDGNIVIIATGNDSNTTIQNIGLKSPSSDQNIGIIIAAIIGVIGSIVVAIYKKKKTKK